MNRLLTTAYPSISFDLSYASYFTYLQFTDKHQSETHSLENLLPEWVGDRRCLKALDIGAGSGRLARTVYDIGVKAEDFSLTLLEPAIVAAENLRKDFQHDDRVVVLEQSLQEMLSANDDLFDFILASHVSYYFEDRDEFFNSLCNLLAPGGVLCLISGSISLLNHPLYRELMPRVLDYGAGERTFDLNGYGSCAEELQLIGFNNGRILSTIRVPASMSFSASQIEQAVKALKDRDECFNNDLCKSLGFLWRTSIETIYEKRELILDFLERQLAENGGIIIPCEDHIMFFKMPETIQK